MLSNIRGVFLKAAAFAAVASLLMACGLFDLVKQAQELAPTAEAFASQIAPTVQAQMTMQPEQNQNANENTQQGGTQNGSASSPSSWKVPSAQSNFKSFRTHQVVQLSLPSSGEQYTLYEIEREFAPDQSSREVVKENGQVVYEAVIIGNTTWLNSGGSWITVTGNNAAENPGDALDAFFPTDSWSNWKLEGTTTLNGQKVQHYTIDLTNFQGVAQTITQFQIPLPGQGSVLFHTQRLQGEAFVLPDGTIIKAAYHFQGDIDKNGQKVPAVLDVSIEVSDINANIQITPPPGASAGAQQSPIPLPPGAVVQMSSPAMNIYTVSGTSIADVLAFFEQTLPQQGYQIASKMGDNNSGWMLQVVTPKGETYTVMVSAGDGPDQVSIMVSK